MIPCNFSLHMEVTLGGGLLDKILYLFGESDIPLLYRRSYK